MYSPASCRMRSTRPSGSAIGIWKARDHDITKVAPAFWAIPGLEKTPSAVSIDGSAERFCRCLVLMLRSVNRGLHVRETHSVFASVSPGEKSDLVAQRGNSPVGNRRRSMSALHIIVGGWLVLSTVVFAVLMLRRGGHVTPPALGGVESDDADRGDEYWP